ncbi:beta-galactosidase [Faecalimicrobium sp. JNUCC 81]
MGRKIISFFMLVCLSVFMVGPYKAQAAGLPYDKLDKYVDKEGLKKVYDTIFNENLIKQDVKIVPEDEAKDHPVAMVKLENGKVAYYVNGEPYYPLAIETGWWDTRVDDNGQMSPNPADVGDNFKEVTDDEWNLYFSDMKNIGFNTVQLMTYWRDWEPVQGQYDFTFLNHVTDLAAKNGLKTELVIFFHSQTDNIPREMDNFWGYNFDKHNIDGRDYALSMQWGNNFTSSADIRADRDEHGGNHAGIENFLAYWHPTVFEGITNALEALGKNFVNSPNIVGYQIGNEEGFNFYVDSGDDKNPYYKELKKMYKVDPKNAGKDDNKFRAETINNLWKCFSNSLHKGDPYKPTTTNTQSGYTEQNNIRDDRYSNDGTTMDFYKSVDMIGSMFYGNASSLYKNLDTVYNTYKNGDTENTYATGFPILFPTEISATMNDGSVTKQITAQTIARGGQGIGLYCYGELYNNFEANGTKYPKSVLGTVETMLKVLKDNKELIHSGLPVTKDMTTNIFMEIKEISNGQGNQGQPTLDVLEGVDARALGVLHFPGNSNSGNGSAGSTKRTVTVTLSAKESGNYKVTLGKTDGTVDVKIVNVKNKKGEAAFTVDTTGLDVVYITAEREL